MFLFSSLLENRSLWSYPHYADLHTLLRHIVRCFLKAINKHTVFAFE